MDHENGRQPTQFMFGPLKCSTYSIAGLLNEIHNLLADRSQQPRTINCVNAHIFNLAWADDQLREALNRSRIVALDGMSVVWAARLFGARPRERCNMTEAFRTFMRDSTFPKTRSILIGGTDEIARRAGEFVGRNCSHTTIVATYSGYLSEEPYRSYLLGSGPLDFVLLGLGTPKTELLARAIAEVRPEAVIWHIGGGTILYLAGQLNEAPVWMRRSGLQWLHRLLQEPRRLWKRYLYGNILFIVRCLYCAARQPKIFLQ